MIDTWHQAGLAYAYDDLDRLVSATNLGDPAQSETFTYAANDNMLSRSRNPGGAFASGGTAPFLYIYPAGTAARPHAPLSVAGRAFTYDANGNTLTDGIRTYTWSNDNRLVSVVRGGQTVSFLYGPDGARSKKTSNLGSTRYFGAEAEEKGGVFTRYPHPDVMLEGATISFLHRDHQASVKLVTSLKVAASTPAALDKRLGRSDAEIDLVDFRPSGTASHRTGYAAYDEANPFSSLLCSKLHQSAGSGRMPETSRTVSRNLGNARNPHIIPIFGMKLGGGSGGQCLHERHWGRERARECVFVFRNREQGGCAFCQWRELAVGYDDDRNLSCDSVIGYRHYFLGIVTERNRNENVALFHRHGDFLRQAAGRIHQDDFALQHGHEVADEFGNRLGAQLTGDVYCPCRGAQCGRSVHLDFANRFQQSFQCGNVANDC